MCWSASIHVYHTCIRRTNVYVYVGLLVEVWTNCLFVLRSTYIFIFKNLFEEKKMWTHTRTSTPVEFEKTDRTLRGTRLLFEAIKVIITTRLRFPTISYPITPKSGPFRGMLWMSQNGIFCPKTHFPENQKTDQKHCENWCVSLGQNSTSIPECASEVSGENSCEIPSFKVWNKHTLAQVLFRGFFGLMRSPPVGDWNPCLFWTVVK